VFNIFDENIIEITRGNSAIIDITPIDTDTGAPYKLSEGDRVLFTLKSKRGTKVFQKVLTNADYESEEDDSLNLELAPEDTIDLISGEYLYDCLLITKDIQAATFISSTLIIKEAIGLYTDPEEDGDSDG
jgi:hypothetical protein